MTLEQYPSNAHISTERFQILRGRGLKVSQDIFELLPAILIIKDNPRRISSSLSNNTPIQLGNLKIERALSAYFSLMNVSLDNQDCELVIEAGLVNPQGDGKLHEYLNKTLGVENRRAQDGYHVISGHLANTSIGPRIALLERIPIDQIKNPLNTLVAETLISHDILPLSAEGYPILFERAFTEWPQRQTNI